MEVIGVNTGGTVRVNAEVIAGVDAGAGIGDKDIGISGIGTLAGEYIGTESI